MEIWEPKPPGTLWATPGLLRDCFTFTFTSYGFVFFHGLIQKDFINFTIFYQFYNIFPFLDGFGGLVVSIMATGTQVRGFKPGRSRWIFRGSGKSSICLPSEGK